MSEFDRTFPAVIAALHQLDFDYADGDGIDFEPYPQFQSAEENVDWIRAWTGNQELDGGEFRIFGQDGTGGLAAIWIRDDKPLLEQPIVFFGSEGELGVVANDFADYLWLLAAGVGPLEALGDHFERAPQPPLLQFAVENAPDRKRAAADIVAAARTKHPGFEEHIQSLCRY
jgi:hypothetical protein